tara:strand:+ start:2385 stop:2531 length:147 start_codon:yes stop_codon:yes gene_type:complete
MPLKMVHRNNSFSLEKMAIFNDLMDKPNSNLFFGSKAYESIIANLFLF